MNNKMVHMVAFILLVVGGLNWLLYAFGFNLVAWIPWGATVEKLVYILVGLSAVYELMTHKANCTMCRSTPM